MSKQFEGGSFRRVHVGYAPILCGSADIPPKAKVIGYRLETFKGVVIESVIYITEENE